MNDSIRHIINYLLTALIITFASTVHATNTNTTTQEGKVNINITHQCSDSNDNVTYQTGKVNINKTVQGCGKNIQRQASHAGAKRVPPVDQQASKIPVKRAMGRERETSVRRAKANEGDN